MKIELSNHPTDNFAGYISTDHGSTTMTAQTIPDLIEELLSWAGVDVSIFDNTISDGSTVTIPKEKYDSLIIADKELDKLYAAGVDNWDGYGYALSM